MSQSAIHLSTPHNMGAPPTDLHDEAEAANSAAARLAARHTSYGRSDYASTSSSAQASDLSLEPYRGHGSISQGPPEPPLSYQPDFTPRYDSYSLNYTGLGARGGGEVIQGGWVDGRWSSRVNPGISHSAGYEGVPVDPGPVNNIEPSYFHPPPQIALPPPPPPPSGAPPPKPSPVWSTSTLHSPLTPLYPSYDAPARQPSSVHPTYSDYHHRPPSPRRMPIPPAPPPAPLTQTQLHHPPSLTTTVPIDQAGPFRPLLHRNYDSFHSDSPCSDDGAGSNSNGQTARRGTGSGVDVYISSRAGVKRKAKYKRTKTGCMCCRRRRIKCDETRPTCLKCVTAKRGCEYEKEEASGRDSENVSSAESGDEGYVPLSPPALSPPTAPPPPPQNKRKRGKPSQPIYLPPPSPEQQRLDVSTLSVPPQQNQSILAQVGEVPDPILPTTNLAWDNTLISAYNDDAENPPQHAPTDSFAASNDMGQVSQSWGGAGAGPMLLAPNFLLPWFPTSEERNLILHYCANAADLMMAIPSGLNPMLAINLPLALDSPRGTNPASDALRIALLGIGAVHQAFLLARSGQSSGQTVSIFQYAASLRTAGKTMVRIAAADRVASRSDAALGAATSLALIDMLFGGSGWEENFNLAKGMIIARGGPAEMLKASQPTPLADGVTVSSARLNLEVLAIYETMGCLTTGQEPILISDRWENWWFGSSRSTYEEHSVEKQFGMSRNMVALFARLTRLLARVGDATREGNGYSDPALVMEAQKMDGDVDAWIETLQITTLEHERVQVGNRAYAHAMKILLLRNVFMFPRTDQRVQTAAAEVLQHCSTSTTLLGMSIDLTWPTIIAASCVEGEARNWVLALFEGFKAQCCFDIETAARIVREVWNRVDKGLGRDDWKQVCEDLGLRVLLC